MHSQLRIWISPDACAAVVALSAAVLEGQVDGVRGLGRLDDQLADEHEEVRPVDLVAVGLVDGLVDGEDGRAGFDQAGAAVRVSDAAVCAHQVGLGQVQIHCVVEDHPHGLAIHGRQLFLGLVGVLGLQELHLGQKLSLDACMGSAQALWRVEHRGSPCLGAQWVGERVVHGLAERVGRLQGRACGGDGGR